LIGDPVFSFFFFVILIFCNSWNQLLRNPVFTSFFVFSDQSRNLFFFIFYLKRNTSWIPAIALNDREGTCGMTRLLSSLKVFIGIRECFEILKISILWKKI
jgi:hypothetical protein